MSLRARRLTDRVGVGIWLVVACLATTAARADAPAASAEAKSADPFANEIRPVIENYCFHCHSGEKPEGKLALDVYRDSASVAADSGRWRIVAERLRDGDMPPEGEDRPDLAELERVTTWIEQTVATAEQGKVRDPGRVTARRLNRVEYNNTIRDLVGLDFRPAKDFPADDVGYGFDNNGDVLSLPPLLMEKYLNAAETIAAAAIVAHPGALREPLNVDLAQAKHRKSGRATDDGGWFFSGNGELLINLPIAPSDSYRILVKAFGQQAGSEPARMELKVDGRSLGVIDVTAVRREPKTYEVVARLGATEQQLSIAFINDYYDSKAPSGARDRNLGIESVRIENQGGEGGELPETHRRIIFRDPTPETEAAAAREILERFAGRAFRRPVEPAEIDRLVKLYQLARDQGDNFAEGIRLGVQATLVSPQFLFRWELDPLPVPDTPAGSIRALGDYDVASRLSYFLWNSMPDETMLVAAAAGKLHDPAAVAAEARRMLTDPKAKSFIQSFAGQWLELRRLADLSPNREAFPTFDRDLAVSMREETERFFAAVVSEDRSVLDFLDGNFTFVNERLAKHYGMPEASGDGFRRVELDGVQRGGILTQASILTLTSNPNRTSPVKRGKWVLENLLAAAPPPPPPNVPALRENKETGEAVSVRQRLEEHRRNPACASCHTQMDAIGFGLENYDGIGAWRNEEAGQPIDASGTLGGQSFAGPVALKQQLRAKPVKFTRCLAEKLLTYALGRGLESYDRAALADIVSRTTSADYRFSAMLEAVVQSDPFLKCRSAGAAP